MEYQAFVARWHESVAAYQTKQGRTFDLTLAQFESVIAPHQRRTIEKHIKAGSLDGFMKHRQWGYVFSWASKEACLTGVMNTSTAKVMTRMASERMNALKKGDKHSDRTKARIGAAKRGRPQSEAHVALRAEAQRGVKRGPISEETKAKIKAAAFAREAAKRA